MITLFKDRADSKAPTFRVRLSDKKGSELTETARSNIMIEHGLVSSKQAPGTLTELYSHYGIKKHSFAYLKKKWAVQANVRSRKRKGRPSLLDDTAKEELRAMNRKNRRATAKQIKFYVKGSKGGGTYRGNQQAHVSKSTVNNWKNKIGYVAKKIKMRPKIKKDGPNAVQRKKYAAKPIRVQGQEHKRLKVDEKYFTVPGRAGNLSYHHDSDDEDDEHYKPVGNKKHAIQILAVALVVKPVIKPGWTDEKDIFEKDGKVGIARVQRLIPAKRGKKKKGLDGKVLRGSPGPNGGKGKELYEYKAGHRIAVDVMAMTAKGWMVSCMPT